MTHSPALRTSVSYDVAIEDFPRLKLATLPHVGDYQKIGTAFERLSNWAGARGMIGADTRTIGIYYDDPSAKALGELRSEAGLTLPDGTAIEADMQWRFVGGGPVAKLIHKGPYADLDVAYAYLYHVWLPQAGRQPGEAPCFEEYLNNPRLLPPSEWLTAVHLPLA